MIKILLAFVPIFVILALILLVKDVFSNPKKYGKLISNFLNKNTFGKDDHKHYVKKDFYMTKMEHEFFKVLEQATQGKYYIIPQVQISNLVYVNKYEKEKRKYWNKIKLKSVDFVLFNKFNFAPEIVVELDDTSHLLPHREQRDIFVNALLERAGFKVVRIKTAYQYNLRQIANLFGVSI